MRNFEWLYPNHGCEYDIFTFASMAVCNFSVHYGIKKLHKVRKCVFALLPLNGRLATFYALHRVSKNIPDIFDSNLKTDDQILIIFGANIPDTTCHQITIQFSISPNICFCTTWGKHNQRNITFLSNAIWSCLINITRKNTFCLHFWHCGWHFIQLSIFQLPAVKLLEVLANTMQGSRCFVHSLTAVSIMFCSSPIHGCTSLLDLTNIPKLFLV